MRIHCLLLSAFATSRKSLARRPSNISLNLLGKAFSTSGGGSRVSSSTDFYTVGITGSSGLIGSAVINELGKRESVNGKPVRVVRLSRGDAAEEKRLDNKEKVTALVWNPKGATADSVIHPEAAAELDAIVHLSGENVSTGMGPLGFLGIRPWTAEKKAEILSSRVGTTEALSKVVAQSAQPKTFLVASGVGIYGDNFIDDSLPAVDESMDTKDVKGFLAQISREWEAATEESKKQKKHRVVNMRFAVTMSKKGGALQKLFPVFFLGGGGRIGSGNQYFTFISARDMARAIVHTLETPSLKDEVNFCAPNPCTNTEFTKALGEVMNRPTLLPFPGFAVSLIFGEMGEEMLLGGVRAIPKKLVDSGFQFLHPTIKEALASALKEDI